MTFHQQGFLFGIQLLKHCLLQQHVLHLREGNFSRERETAHEIFQKLFSLTKIKKRALGNPKKDTTSLIWAAIFCSMHPHYNNCFLRTLSSTCEKWECFSVLTLHVQNLFGHFDLHGVQVYIPCTCWGELMIILFSSTISFFGTWR